MSERDMAELRHEKMLDDREDFTFAESEEGAHCVACDHHMADVVPCDGCGDTYCREHLFVADSGALCEACMEEVAAAATTDTYPLDDDPALEPERAL